MPKIKPLYTLTILIFLALLAPFAFADSTDLGGGSGIPISEKGAANGVATLDGTGKVPVAQIPGGGGGAVDSVNGQTGVVVLDTDDISEGATNLYATNARSISALLTGYVSGAGTVAATDSILQAIQKLNGNASAGLAAKWDISGNAGTSPATNFVGTSDAQDLSIRRNSVEKLLVGNAITVSSNVMQVPDGAVGAPGLRLTTDGDTGLYQTGDGNLSIAANGGQKVSVDQTSTTFFTDTISPSVVTPLVGTTSAADLVLRANSVNVLTVESDYPGLSSSVTQVPADSTGINQFDFRTFVTPAASTTNASHTGMFSQLVYDNGNAGFDSTGGAYLANAANVTNNGSGTLGFASIYSGSASFNNAGTTTQFKGISSENTIASGATVSDYYGMVSGLNTTGGIVPSSNTLSLYGNFTDATIGNASSIGSNLSFSGTTANSQGVNAFSSSLQFNDSTTVTNGVNGLNVGIDLNNTSDLNGVTGSNVYMNVRDTATHGGINLYNAGLNQEDSAVNTSGVNAFNANLGFSGTSSTGGVTLFSGYTNVTDTAHLDGFTGISFNPEIQGTSDVDNVTMGSFDGQIRANATVDNLTGVNIGTQMSGSATATNFSGLNVNPQVNGTAVLSNTLTGIQVSPASTADLSGVTGINVNVGNATLSAAALAAGAQKTGFSSDGAFNSGYNYVVPGAAGFFQINYLGGGPVVAAGDPTSAFGFGNNFAHSVTLQDDWNLDGAGLGFVDVGFVGSLAFDAGTTMAQWTGALGGAGNPSGAGTLTTAKMFSAAGILPQGGSLTVTNMYGFEVNPNLFCLIGTNCWGFFENTASAENHLSKLAIGTGTFKVANSSTALEIGNSKAFLNGRGDEATRDALTAVAGMQFYNTDTDQLEWYDGSAWQAMGGGGGASPRTTGTITGDTAIPTLVKDRIVNVDATGGAVVVTLPDATASDGWCLDVKKVDASANAASSAGAGGDTVDGAATYDMILQNEAARLCAVGGDWFVY